MTLAKSRVALAVVMLATVCGGPLGCAVKAQPAALPQAPSDEVRAQLNIGVAARRYLPIVQLQAPTSGRGWGALKGAGYGLVAGATPGLAIASAAGGCGGGGPAAVVCGSILLLGLGVGAAGGTLGALGGTLYGAVTAEPASRISAAETELRSALDDLGVQETLRNHVLRVAPGSTSLKFVALEDHAPTGSGDYLALAMNDVDTVLEVGLSSIRLAGDGIDPPVRLVMRASARLVRTADGAELFA
ncbi:MAG: hypothetical protein ACREK4_12590, partial [Candidatus Rokuibacteriota bacterium]